MFGGQTASDQICADSQIGWITEISNEREFSMQERAYKQNGANMTLNILLF